MTFDAGEPERAAAERARAPALARARLRRHRAPRRSRIVDAVLEAPLDTEGEHALLEVYADVRALNRPHAASEPGGEALASPQEHLHAFLRSLDADAEGLPDRFVAQLERALGHFGVDGLERTRRARGRRLPPVPRPAARGHRARGGARAARRGASSRPRSSPATAADALRARARPPRGRARAARARARRAGPRAALARLRPPGHRGGARGDLRRGARAPGGARRAARRRRPRGAPAGAGRLPAAARAAADAGHGRLPARGADAALLPHPPLEGLERRDARRRPVPAHLLRARGRAATTSPPRSPSPTACRPRWPRSRRTRARCPEGEPLLADLYGPRRRGRRPLVADADLPPAVARLAFVSAGRGTRGRRDAASRASPTAR